MAPVEKFLVEKEINLDLRACTRVGMYDAVSVWPSALSNHHELDLLRTMEVVVRNQCSSSQQNTITRAPGTKH